MSPVCRRGTPGARAPLLTLYRPYSRATPEHTHDPTTTPPAPVADMLGAANGLAAAAATYDAHDAA